MAAGGVSSGFSSDDDALLSDINVTPLVDVVLVLLIVFMITVPAIVGSAPVKVDLPESTAIAAAPPETLPLVFSLKRAESGAQELYLNDRPTDEAQIRAMFENNPPGDSQSISLSADKTIAWNDVVKILDLLQSVGLKHLKLDTRHVEPPRR